MNYICILLTYILESFYRRFDMELLQLKYFKDAAELENFSNAAAMQSKNLKKNLVYDFLTELVEILF